MRDATRRRDAMRHVLFSRFFTRALSRARRRDDVFRARTMRDGCVGCDFEATRRPGGDLARGTRRSRARTSSRERAHRWISFARARTRGTTNARSRAREGGDDRARRVSVGNDRGDAGRSVDVDRLDRDRLDRLDRSIPTRSIDIGSIDRHRIDGRNRIDGRDAIGSISDSGVGLGGGLGRFPAHYGERARKG